MMPCQEDLSATEFQMHSLEMEAYSAVLRAFHAQSDCLTWEREALISELRKELRVSDVEHREFLSKVNSDDTVKIIREWHDDVARKQKTLSNTMNVPLKKLKTTHITGSPSPRFQPCAKPSTAANPSPLTNECGNDTAAYSNQGNEGQGLKIDAHSRHQPSMVKRTAPVVVKMKKGFSNLGVENINRGSDTFEILATDRLIDEVEMILRQNPNPFQMHKVKLVLREQERALCKALEKLIDVSIEDDSPDQLRQRYSHQDMQRFGQGSDDDDMQRFGRGSFNPIFGQVDGVRGFVAQSASMGRRDLADR